MPCTSPRAEFKVLRVLDTTDTDACRNLPDVEAAYYRTDWRGRSYTLCLGRNG